MGLISLPIWQRILIGILGFFAITIVAVSLAGPSSGMGIFLVIVLIVIYPIVFYRIAFKTERQIMIRCPNCKYEGRGEFKTKGSFAVEVILWLLLLVPGLIYSVWRLSNKRWVCPQCNFNHVVKLGPMVH